MNFIIRIQLGNAAMLTPHDVAATLRGIADQVDEHGKAETQIRVGSQIADENGNTIGHWQLDTMPT